MAYENKTIAGVTAWKKKEEKKKPSELFISLIYI